MLSLHALCELRLDRDDLQPLIDEAAFPKPGRRPQPLAGGEPKAPRGPTDSTDMGQYRPQPFAQDAAGCSYWCIDSDASMRGARGGGALHTHIFVGLFASVAAPCRWLCAHWHTASACFAREQAPASQPPPTELMLVSVCPAKTVRQWGWGPSLCVLLPLLLLRWGT